MAQRYKLYDDLNFPVQEAYSTLRTNIQHLRVNGRIKTIAVTSYSPGEGKTTTSINLAISMAKAGLKTLLIDADIRKPVAWKSLSGCFPLGLTNLLMGYSEVDEVIGETNINGLFYMPGGTQPPNPSELLNSDAFIKFIAAIRDKFDMIIFDTPPMGSVIDCALISTQADGVVFVIKSGKINGKTACRVKEQLEKVNARLLGVVLNNIRKSDYKKYFQYYRYYGSEKQNRNKPFKKVRQDKVDEKVLAL